MIDSGSTVEDFISLHSRRQGLSKDGTRRLTLPVFKVSVKVKWKVTVKVSI